MRKLLVLLAAVSFNAAAANNDDGFVWVDANTKIRLKPIGAAGSAAAGTSAPEKAPEPAKKQKRQKQKK